MLSDVKVDYPLDVDFRQQIQNVKSKTIIDDFSILLDRVEELYGLNVSFNFKDEVLTTKLFAINYSNYL